MGMVASAEHCVLTVRTDDGSGQFGLIICNAIGTPVDSESHVIEELGKLIMKKLLIFFLILKRIKISYEKMFMGHDIIS